MEAADQPKKYAPIKNLNLIESNAQLSSEIQRNKRETQKTEKKHRLTIAHLKPYG